MIIHDSPTQKNMDMCNFPQLKTIPALSILRARRLKVTSGPSGPLFTPLREFQGSVFSLDTVFVG